MALRSTERLARLKEELQETSAGIGETLAAVPETNTAGDRVETAQEHHPASARANLLEITGLLKLLVRQNEMLLNNQRELLVALQKNEAALEQIAEEIEKSGFEVYLEHNC